MQVSKNRLKTLALLTWYSGFVALFIKSYKLFVEAYTLDNDIENMSVALMSGVVFGLIKTKYIFIKSCQKNLRRIESLTNPKIWEFYRVRFFIFLATMISLGAYLSNSAHGNYWFLMGVAILDMALALALLLSSKAFWEKRGLKDSTVPTL